MTWREVSYESKWKSSSHLSETIVDKEMQQLNIYKIAVSRLGIAPVHKYGRISNLSLFSTSQMICVIYAVTFFTT